MRHSSRFLSPLFSRWHNSRCKESFGFSQYSTNEHNQWNYSLHLFLHSGWIFAFVKKKLIRVQRKLLMEDREPKRPVQLDPLAVELLTRLAPFSCTRHIVLGGYFALKHYCDYRVTHDVDAWWSAESTDAERSEVRQVLESVLNEIAQHHGLHLQQRRFGDTESWELMRQGVKIFSFQIAARTVQLEPYLQSPWPPLMIESLTDNVGSKMNALVLRGAPRDFVDIRQLIAAGIISAGECWATWQRKNPDLLLEHGQAEVARHLHELELRRPLKSIADTKEQKRAQEIRTWFREIFLKPSSP